ncbi:allatotropins-like isoform X2 [Battus philenor]|uniref:allatotropins-like isoform X2 n=1 Tax=Battus philenor TaxID=42288 RepID=UPI0035CF4D8F
MNISMQVVIVVAAVCLCLADGAPEARLTRKQQRPTRGFKNVEMMTARGFGKRDRSVRTEHKFEARRKVFRPKVKLMVAPDYGKRSGNDEINDEVFGLDNVWDSLENNPERDNQEFTDDKVVESIPLDWFVNEMVNNPDFARSVIRKFIDINQDGLLSPEELLRNVA